MTDGCLTAKGGAPSVTYGDSDAQEGAYDRRLPYGKRGSLSVTCGDSDAQEGAYNGRVSYGRGVRPRSPVVTATPKRVPMTDGCLTAGQRHPRDTDRESLPR